VRFRLDPGFDHRQRVRRGHQRPAHLGPDRARPGAVPDHLRGAGHGPGAAWRPEELLAVTSSRAIIRKSANVVFFGFCAATTLIALGVLAAILYSLLKQ